MSRFKGTPEAWQMHGPSPGRSVGDDGGDWAIYVERGGTNHIIAEVICQTRQDNSEPAFANARAIAAVPQLIEALERAEDKFSTLLLNAEKVTANELAAASESTLIDIRAALDAATKEE